MESERSDLVFAEASFGLFDERLMLSALRAQPLADAENADYPGRTALRANFALNDTANIFAAYEWHEGAAFEGVLARAGLSVSPWDGGQITTSAGMQTAESSERLMSNLGVSQTWTFGDGWSASAAVDVRETLEGTAQSATPSQLRSADWIGQDYVAGSLGLAHGSEHTGFSARIEGRGADDEDRLLLQVGHYDETRQLLGLSNDFTLQASRTAFGESFPLIRFRQGIAVRDGLRGRTVLYRLDLVFRELPIEDQLTAGLALRQWRLVGNSLFHFELTPESELALQFGLKLTNDEVLGVEYSGAAGLIGADLRYDLSSSIDIGVSGSVMALWPSGELSGHLGFSLGVSPADNLWLSAGVNLVGYDDSDFLGGDYRSEGVFARLRFKFDEDTARSVLAR